jgi:hypothetical protein
MNRFRLLLLAVALTVLLVLAGIASNGRPLSGGEGDGPTPAFFDYVYTTIALLGVALFLVFVYAVMTTRLRRTTPTPRKGHLWSTLLAMAIATAIAMLIARGPFGDRLREAFAKITQQQEQAERRATPTSPNARAARLRWDEVLLMVAVLTGVGVLLVATRPRGRPLRRPTRERSQDAIAAALDESLDDLRTEPDLRRAIIAAYARMERELARIGVPRHPAEAPFEYVERALRELDASATAATRLTGLFEWAKFSQHEPDPAMRDDAIDALIAVRDELRAPTETAVA